MPYFVCLFRDASGAIRDAAVVGSTYGTVTAIAAVSEPIESAPDAAAMERQLREQYRLPARVAETLNKKKPRRRVKCWQTGVIFNSASAAAAWLGVAPTMMTRHLNHPQKLGHIKGHTFEKVD